MTGARRTVLIVEDDPDIAAWEARFLEADGWVTSITGGVEAIAWLESNPRPDVVLTGVMMPGMDGFELTARIREMNGPPVVICTAKSLRSDVQMGFASGAAAFIHKPFDPPALIDVVDRVAGGETDIGPIKAE